MTYSYKLMKSPVGELKLVASDKGLGYRYCTDYRRWHTSSNRRGWCCG